MAKTSERVVRAVSRRLWERDRLQMRVADAVLSAVEPKRRRGRSPAGRSAAWSGFQSVLCAVDFSEHSRLALRYAEAVALRGRSALTVAYVNDPLLVAAAAAALRDRSLVKQSARELREFVNAELSVQARKRLRVTVRAAVGSPSGGILTVARREQSNLIVVGTHGLTGAARAVAGSTTLGVLQRATMPVLAVPPPDRLSGPARSWPGRRIIAALDWNGDAARDLDVAARIARWFGTSLLAVHVVPDTPTPTWLARHLHAHRRDRAAAAQRQLDALAAHVRRPVRVETRVIEGDVARDLAGVAGRQRAGLVITALRDRETWFGAARGSISYDVLAHAATPVLAIPPGWPRR